ncbi:cyclic pyranopterin monophosphate synthase subunit MoaC [Agromyces sp. CF514]|uniref:bifunctional molybdenum cofactor biosynthesis protein MoaC/MoaB n=1 Tax=Agromyces sp. CF514 TaxID=1881031 RepID=UPI0008E334B6|nr:bifunctional molybdenum cofactor biosynthesis protein MoaC/MoaB [Agromyces sp. CF514]SFR82528.1 cyclic pyranopterin monophosphate synthase subunit MoaC [Agromyces sp. CF514]
MNPLTHLDDDGRARMVDVGGKPVTRRVAIAEGRLDTTAEVVALVQGDALKKADVLPTARIAGIQAAKRTSELIPLAHIVPLDAVSIDFGFEATAVTIRATVSTTARTGIEMEALTAVAVAALTLHDMVKAVDPAAQTGGIRLVEKRGGKRGVWRADAAGATDPSVTVPAASPAADATDADAATEGRRSAIVLVASTRAAAGEAPDTTGPVIVDWLRTRGYEVPAPVVVADADIGDTVRGAVAGSPTVLITTGGTGVNPGDRTPEATLAVLDQELPGVAEAIRAAGRAVTPTAALSRARAGIAGRTVVVNLPGSRGGVADGLAVLDDLLPHVVDQVAGGDHAASAGRGAPDPIVPPHPTTRTGGAHHA